MAGTHALPNKIMPAPLIVILGETASGKSALGVELAERFGGEIICADSRTVYRGLDIGTAKPTADERARVRHWGLDLVTPAERFTAAAFKAYAHKAIDDINSRGRPAIMVGGTGLYIDAVIYDFQFRPPPDPAVRAELAALSVEELQQRLHNRGIALPENARNPRHLTRALETGGASAGRGNLRAHTLLIGLQLPRPELRRRLTARVEAMTAAGLADEVRIQAERYGWDAPGLQAPAYRAFRGYLEGSKTLQQAKDDFIQNDLSLAKRQRTWFRRNKSIHWLSTEDKSAKAVDLATTFLNNCFSADRLA